MSRLLVTVCPSWMMNRQRRGLKMLGGLWWFKKKKKKKKESCDGWKEEGIDKKRPVQCVAGVTLALWRKGRKSWS